MAETAQPRSLVAAVDIGGTKIAAALVDADGRVLEGTRRPTPAGTGSPSTVLAAVLEAVSELHDHARWAEVRAVGIGSAGPVDLVKGSVSPVNIPAWRDFPLVAEVGRHPTLAGLPVTLLGDGAAFAEGEHWMGAAAGYRHVLCMVVSTGVGAGLVLDGEVHLGKTGNAGHVGHVVVDMNGPSCACGGRGCLEAIASGTAIARYAREQGWRSEEGDGSAAAVAEAAGQGDPVALAAFDRAARALAAGVASTAALVEIEAVVIGGGVAQSASLLFPPLSRYLENYAALPFIHGIRLHRARLGSDAGLIGAARAALRVGKDNAWRRES